MTTMTTARMRGPTTAMREKRVGWACRGRSGGVRGSGSLRRPGRGGRLKGTVPAAVMLCSDPGRGARGSSTSLRAAIAQSPMRSTASASMRAPSSSTASPSRRVPLVEPRSLTSRPSSSRSTVACSQEALREGRGTSASGERPMVSTPVSGTRTTGPTPSSPSTVRVQPDRASSASPPSGRSVLPSMSEARASGSCGSWGTSSTHTGPADRGAP